MQKLHNICDLSEEYIKNISQSESIIGPKQPC